GLPRGGTQPGARRASPEPARPHASARATGRTRAPPPRTRAAAARAAARSARWPRGAPEPPPSPSSRPIALLAAHGGAVLRPAGAARDEGRERQISITTGRIIGRRRVRS